MTKNGESITHSVSRRASQHQDSKFNVVLYGVDECPSGLSRSTRSQSDLNSIISILSSLDNDIVHQSVKAKKVDLPRLDRYANVTSLASKLAGAGSLGL